MSERRSDAWATEVFDTILRSIRKNDFIMDLFEDEVDEADVVWALRRARNEVARRSKGGQGEESEAAGDVDHN